MKEIKSLTGLRGIAAIWVVFLHYFTTRPEVINDFLKEHNYKLFAFFELMSRGYIAVDLFFMLSAFVLLLSNRKRFENGISKEDYITFMKNRFIRVYPLYLFYVIVYFVLEYIVNSNIQPPLYWLVNLSFLGVFFNQYLIIIIIWSLCTEFFMYMLMPLIMRYVKTFNSSILLLILGVILIISLQEFKFTPIGKALNLDSLGRLNEQNTNNLDIALGINALLRCIAAYLIGVFFFFLATKENIMKSITKYWFVVFAGIISTIYLTRNDTILVVLLGLLMLSALGNNILSKILSSRIVYFSGLISYSIYLNHCIYLAFFDSFQFIPGGRFLQFAFIFIATILSSIITYYAIEKYFSKVLKKWLFPVKTNFVNG